MNASTLPRLRLLGAASILVIAASAAMAQSGPESQPAGATQPSGAAKAGEKAGPESKKASKPAKPAASSGYATESEARAHCHGSVVWVDSDNFNHYPGSREYGKKPGAFACEKG